MSENSQQSISQKLTFWQKQFQQFGDNQEMIIEHLLTFGVNLPTCDQVVLSENELEKSLVKGCSSQTLIWASFKNNQLTFDGASDAIIPRSILAVLFDIVNQQDPKSILAFDSKQLYNISIFHYLSPSRSNGTLNMLRKIKDHASAFIQTNQQ